MKEHNSIEEYVELMRNFQSVESVTHSDDAIVVEKNQMGGLGTEWSKQMLKYGYATRTHSEDFIVFERIENTDNGFEFVK